MPLKKKLKNKKAQENPNPPTQQTAEVFEEQEEGDEEILDDEDIEFPNTKRKRGRPKSGAADELFYCPFDRCKKYSKISSAGCKKDRVHGDITISDC